MKPLSKKIWAEFIGTFFIILIGCGSIMINSVKRNDINQLGIALSFGITFIIVAYLFYGISGSHFNPSVSFSLFITGKMSAKEFIGYILSQFGGGLLAGLLLMIMFVKNAKLGAVSYEDGVIQARFEIGAAAIITIVEFAAAFLLMLVYTFSAKKSRSNSFLPLLAGAVYFVFILIFHRMEGAGLNPVRILVPHIYANGKWDMILYYIIGSFSGAFAGTITGHFLFRK